jgi:hypothetical protein
MKKIILTLAAMIPLCGCVGAIQSATLHKEVQENQKNVGHANESCKSELDQDAALGPLHGKVELYRTDLVSSPPFAMLTNESFAAGAELPAIAHWADVREKCRKAADAAFQMPKAAYDNQRQYVTDLRNMIRSQLQGVDSLLVALYQQKVTYGEFAQKRFDISRDTSAIISEMRRAADDRDAQRAAVAQQSFANAMGIWSSYIAAVNARPARTVIILRK